MYFVFCISNTFWKCILYLYLKYILMYLYFIFQAKNTKYILMRKYDAIALISKHILFSLISACITNLAMCGVRLHNQWRRQTLKSGSAFKGQLYFPGRAERDAGGAKRLSAERVGSGEIRESGGYIPRKISKNQLWNRAFSAILQSEIVSSAVLARQLIRHYEYIATKQIKRQAGRRLDLRA